MFKDLFMLLLGIILGITTSISIAFALMLKVVLDAEERKREERKTKFNYSRL